MAGIVNDKSDIIRSKPTLSFTDPSTGFKDDVKKLIQSNAIYDRYEMDWYNRFTRFGVIDPYNSLINAKEYIFITRPDLPLFTVGGYAKNPCISVSSMLTDAVDRYPEVAKQLQLSADRTYTSKFINILSNSVTSSLAIPGLAAESIETGRNVMGTKISYRSSSIKSDEDCSFDLEFEDTKNLDVYMLFKMYDEYEQLKWNGLIDYSNTGGSEKWINYVKNKVLHDQMSIYKIVVAEDGYRIIYWARITGCYPDNIPRDAVSNLAENSGGLKFSVGWKGHFVRDMDPVILYHFNKIALSGASSMTDIPLYDRDNLHMNGAWPKMPYIFSIDKGATKNSTNTRKEYYLRWYE